MEINQQILTNSSLDLAQGEFIKNSNYYYNFNIKINSDLPDDLELSLFLINKNDTTSKQIIYKKTIYNKDFSDEIVFTPRFKNRDEIQIELNYKDISYTIDGNAYQLPNLLKKLEINKNIVKLGIQSNKGNTIEINGALIKIGKTGIYEMFNGIKVSSLSLIDEGTYIIDYQCKGDEEEYGL